MIDLWLNTRAMLAFIQIIDPRVLLLSKTNLKFDLSYFSLFIVNLYSWNHSFLYCFFSIFLRTNKTDIYTCIFLIFLVPSIPS